MATIRQEVPSRHHVTVEYPTYSTYEELLAIQGETDKYAAEATAAIKETQDEERQKTGKHEIYLRHIGSRAFTDEECTVTFVTTTASEALMRQAEEVAVTVARQIAEKRGIELPFGSPNYAVSSDNLTTLLNSERKHTTPHALDGF